MFCTNCGEAAPDAEIPFVCKKCGAVMPSRPRVKKTKKAP